MSKLCQGVCQNGSAVQPQFKLEAVRLVRERGVTVAQAFGLGQLVAQVQHKVFLKHGHAILVSPSHHTPMAKRKSQEGAQFVKFFGPLLGALRELGGSGTPDEVVEQIAADLALSDEVQNELLPSGQPRFRNQVAWARFYLVQEGLLDSSKRGVWGLTEKGRATPLTHEQAREIFLRWVKVFQEQRRAKAATEEPIAEQVAEGTGSPSKDYRAETVELLLALPPAGFERLSQRLLREAGFTQVVVTGQSGDGGIDGHGTLQINPLVSFKVLFQCKRFTKSVSLRTFVISAALWPAVPTKASSSQPARLPLKPAAKDHATASRKSSLLMGRSSSKCWGDLELGLRPVKTFEINHSFFSEFRS